MGYYRGYTGLKNKETNIRNGDVRSLSPYYYIIFLSHWQQGKGKKFGGGCIAGRLRREKKLPAVKRAGKENQVLGWVIVVVVGKDASSPVA